MTTHTPARTTTPTTRPWRPRRGGRIAGLVLAITTGVAGLLAAVAYLLGQLVEFIATHAAAAIRALIVLALIAAALTYTSSGRRHCPGC